MRAVILSTCCFCCLVSAQSTEAFDAQSTTKVKVAAVRVTWQHGGKESAEATIERGLKMTVEAAKRGAKYIVLPESFLYSSDPADQVIPGPLTDRVVAIAHKYGVYICVGMIESEKCQFKERWDKYISAVFVGPQGVLSVHRKVDVVASARARQWVENSPKTDRGAWAGGDFEMHCIGELKRVGIMICRDSFSNWAWSRVLSQDPQIIFHPNLRSSIVKYGPNLPAMARKYAVPIVAPDGHPDSESLIIDRTGDIVDMETEKDRILLGKVSLADEHPNYTAFEVIDNRPHDPAKFKKITRFLTEKDTDNGN